MKKARYISTEENILIEAKSITPKQYERTYRGKLYCEQADCNAQLVFNERQKGKFVRYFSTLQGSNHKKGCPNEIKHKKGKSRCFI